MEEKGKVLKTGSRITRRGDLSIIQKMMIILINNNARYIIN
jgi:hypothetical protein